eukprot:TRINITY_DN6128_c0_g1_i27.p1 TRINITY_DN6128_c0_g1~~TRINITY_DN6128_c0_g1_i27.p1  ORF type:complete len:322 (+),score=70.87 TRINITY_DN6128_c0_g1_i27:396-1361(+)
MMESSTQSFLMEIASIRAEMSKLREEYFQTKERELKLETQLSALTKRLAENQNSTSTPVPVPIPVPAVNPLLEALKKAMAELMDSKKVVDEEAVQNCKKVFVDDSGRRLFTHLLEAELENNKGTKELRPATFELLLFLISACLNTLHLKNPADYICGKIIFETSGKFFRRKVTKLHGKDKDSLEFIKPFIQDHFVWQNLFFWEEYFWDSVAQSFSDQFGQTTEFKSIHKEFIKNKLTDFYKVMEGWGRLPLDSIALLAENIATDCELDNSQIDWVVQTISGPKQRNVVDSTALTRARFNSVTGVPARGSKRDLNAHSVNKR